MQTLHFHRTDQHFLGSWWRTIDRLTLVALLIIIAFSAIMVATASPAVADRIGVESYYFIRRQLIYLILAVAIIAVTSFLSPVHIRRIGVFGTFIGMLLLIVVLFHGTEIKGSKRWLALGPFSMQPSEFIKPFFAITTGWILSLGAHKPTFPAFHIAGSLLGILALLLILQPDFGMTVTLTAVWGGQMFLAGLSLLWIVAAVVIALAGVTGAYLLLPHVTRRINTYLDPDAHENYQVKRSLEAFMNGGITGRGPGEGTVKQVLPDSHTDFIFAVVGEELGFIACMGVLLLFAFIVIRGFIRVSKETDLFSVYAASGILMQFGMQAVFNMGVTLHLFPTKGMTLPFISYGGSSMIAIAVAMGMMLALTRRRYGLVKYKR
jgi:cell division protein FtsW